MIIDLSNRDIEVIKIKHLNKNIMQSFKRKYCKTQKYLIRQIDKKEGNKNKIIELITEFIEDMIDDSIKIVNDLDELLNNIIRDQDNIAELFIKYTIIILSLRHNKIRAKDLQI